MQLAATATRHAAGLLGGASRPARVLGAFPTACYLEPASGGVLALLTADAVQLPIGLSLPCSSTEFPLQRLLGEATVGGGLVRLGGLEIVAGATRSAGLRPSGRPRVPAWPSPLFDDPVPAVAQRLGRGPGLTPAGDDELCGALAAITLFGIAGSTLPAAVVQRLSDGSSATTSLSRALLERAVAGEGLPQLQAVADALCGRGDAAQAWRELQRIGHSSGPALAAGLLAGARHAVSIGKAA